VTLLCNSCGQHALYYVYKEATLKSERNVLTTAPINGRFFSNSNSITEQLIPSRTLRLERLRTIDLTASASAPGKLHLRISPGPFKTCAVAYVLPFDPATRGFATQLCYVLLEYN